MTQPEALRLADELEMWTLGEPAAAELRRLHAENEALREANEAFGKRQEWWNEKMFAIEQQRDALLEALKRMASIIDKMGDMPDGFIHPSPWQTLKCEEALTQARAAITKAEGEKE